MSDEVNKKGTPKRPVGRSRSDSTPLQVSSKASETAAFPQGGDTNLSKRWRSWSFPGSQYGIPLGSLTAREAAKSFWSSDMLKQRLEKIAECAALETSCLQEEVDLENSVEGEQTILSNKDDYMAPSSKVEDAAYDSADTDDHDDDLFMDVRSSPELIPSPEHVRSEDWEELQEQSTMRLKIDNSNTTAHDDGLFVIRSAPALTQRQVEPFPAAMLSHSTHIF